MESVEKKVDENIGFYAEVNSNQSSMMTTFKELKTTDTIVETIQKDQELKQENQDLKANKLESNLLKDSQETLQNAITLSNIPYQQGESILEILKNVCAFLGFPYHDGLFVNYCRYKTKDQTFSNTIIVHFMSTIDKANFMIKFKEKRQELNWGSICCTKVDDEKCNKVYINESMSAENKKLFKEAKVLKNSGVVKYVWFKSGKIYYRIKDNTPTKQIVNEEDIINLKKLAVQDETDSSEFSFSEKEAPQMANKSKEMKTERRKRKKSPRLEDSDNDYCSDSVEILEYNIAVYCSCSDCKSYTDCSCSDCDDRYSKVKKVTSKKSKAASSRKRDCSMSSCSDCSDCYDCKPTKKERAKPKRPRQRSAAYIETMNSRRKK